MKKRIAFLNIFSGSNGGGEVYLRRLINAISPYITEDSFLISPECPALNATNISKKFISGIPIDCQSLKTRFKLYLQLVRQVRKILRSSKIDVLVVSGDRAIALYPLFGYNGFSVGIKHMLINNALKFLINIWGFRTISKIVTISNFHKKNYSRWFSEKLISRKLDIIRNSVDTSYFNTQPDTRTNIIKFVEVASLEKRKGQLDLINVFFQLTKTYNNVELHFYGQGIELNAYKNYISKLGLNDTVFFHGHIDDVREIYEDGLTVFVLPSYEEGLPLSILEALSCSTPVISTLVAGIPEAVENRVNGFLINPGNLIQLKKSMEYFIQRPSEIYSFGEKGRQIAISKFDEQDWIKSWQDILV